MHTPARQLSALLAACLLSCAAAYFGVAVPRARAQSCCSTTSTNEFAVVGRSHYAIIASELSYDHGLQHFDAGGRVHSLGDDAYRDLVWRVGAGFRLPLPSLQLHGALPLRLQHRRAGEDAATDTALGDASASLRWTATEDTTDGIDTGDAESLVPYLDFFFGAKAPTGRAPSASRLPTAADVGGNGQWEVSAGTKVSKYLTSRHAVQVIAQYLVRRPRNLAMASAGAPDRFTLGDVVQVQLGWIHIDSMRWAWGTSADLTVTGRARQALPGQALRPVPASATRRMRVGAFITHALRYPSLDISLSAALDPPLDGLGRNLPSAGATVGVKLGYNVVGSLF